MFSLQLTAMRKSDGTAPAVMVTGSVSEQSLFAAAPTSPEPASWHEACGHAVTGPQGVMFSIDDHVVGSVPL